VPDVGTKDPRIDTYIAKAAPFAQPILRHIRKLVHQSCPDVQETVKWGMPHFEHQGVLCHMASFKAHCAFGFWRASEFDGVPRAARTSAMGQFGRITSKADLPSDKALAGLVKQAVALNAAGKKKKAPTKKAAKTPRAVVVPAALLAALNKNKKARAGFDGMSPSHQREYCEWIAEAKRDETRARRVQTAVAQLCEGKSMNWKYE